MPLDDQSVTSGQDESGGSMAIPIVVGVVVCVIIVVFGILCCKLAKRKRAMGAVATEKEIDAYQET